MSGIVLVTGAAGFVGSHLVQRLSQLEHSRPVVVGWRRPNSPDRKRSSPPPRPFGDGPSVKWQEVDLLDRESVIEAIASLRPTAIYHCAGAAAVVGSWINTSQTLESNVRGTQYVLEGFAKAGHDARILIPGSALVYKPSPRAVREDDAVGPVSPYGLSKLAQEMLGQQFAGEGLSVLFTRSFTHLGPGQDFLYAASSFAHQIARIEAGDAEPVINVGSLDARRDLTDVRDTVDAYLDLMAHGISGRLYNVCSGKAHKIGDVLNRLLEETQTPVQIQIDPDRVRLRDNTLLLGDPSRIREEVGWQPRIPLRETLRDLINYWRDVIRGS